MEGKRHEFLRVMEYLLQKEKNRLSVLGNTGRLHTDLMVYNYTVANVQFLVKRNGYFWFISANKMLTKPSS
jgi:hypothetical protein